ncbi:hypothetical protein [Moritella sp. F3]|uniref:hypothetical protein n=1 Tax=Moritella sp. F3 TaxID=2718882 RepID=UPI0018E0FB33|nr:hypothetical protein [Moritella sp. F3]GIC77032.1 hypothetical protein FMO001_17590 [Moritella sp. F1]GIC82151.1 hypothetical protein FMO003_24320 [Moritella sp. F3]
MMDIQRLLSEGMRLISKSLIGEIAGGVDLAKDLSAVMRTIGTNTARLDEKKRLGDMIIKLVNKYSHLDSLLFYVTINEHDIEIDLRNRASTFALELSRSANYSPSNLRYSDLGLMQLQNHTALWLNSVIGHEHVSKWYELLYQVHFIPSCQRNLKSLLFDWKIWCKDLASLLGVEPSYGNESQLNTMELTLSDYYAIGELNNWIDSSGLVNRRYRIIPRKLSKQLSSTV